MNTEFTNLINKETTTNYNGVTKPGWSADSSRKKQLIGVIVSLLLVAGAFFSINQFGSKSIINYNKKDVSSTTTTSSTSSTNPNIIFILMDDMGYGDISLRGSEYETPNLDNLYSDSIVINNHYIGLVCSPSRSQILSGRFAWNLGFSIQEAYAASTIQSLPAGFPLLPQLLNQYTDYKSYLVGKWQLGYSTNEHLPRSRGFGEFYGFYTSGISYETKLIESELYDDNYYDWRANGDVDYDTLDTYSTFVHGDKVEQIINTHVENSPEKPFYIHAAFQAPHIELFEVDSENVANCDVVEVSDDEDDDDYTELRNLMCQNMLAVDQAIGNIVNNLKNINDVWDNTLIIFTSDNGGAFKMGGCNEGLRGGKDTFFEGGIKTIAFLSGGYVTSIKDSKKYNKLRSDEYKRFYDKDSYSQHTELHTNIGIDTLDIDIRHDGLMHGVDWVPTILSIAGADIDQVEAELQENLYIPIAKEVSSEEDGTEDNYKDYLMDYALDGKDLSQWILYGDKDINDRDHLPFSVNIRSTDEDQDQFETIDNGEDDENENSLDNVILFTSTITGHQYKLMYLDVFISSNKKNTEFCTYEEKDDNSEDNLRYKRTYTKESLSVATKLLFDLTLETVEKTNLIEMISDEDDDSSKSGLTSDSTTNALEDDLQKIADNYLLKENRAQGSRKNVNGVKNNNDINSVNVNSLDDYDYDLILLLWEEGIELVETYSNTPIFNTDLNCVRKGYTDDADPALLENGDAYGPFFTWTQYSNKFNVICGDYINPVLLKLYTNHYDSYVNIDNSDDADADADADEA